MTAKRFINDIDNEKLIDTKGELSTIYYSDSVDFYELWEFLNKLNDENEQLKNRVDELEDDNMKYTLSTDKLKEYTKRFMPTKCINEFRDCKTNRYYWLDNEDNFTGALELLNLLDCENEQLKERNNRQAKRLAELYELMAKKDWESLTEIIDDFCSCEEQLQREWRTYE